MNDQKEIMMKKYIYTPLLIALISLFGTGCSLDFDPIDSYSDVTEGIDESGNEIVFRDRASVISHLQTLYQQMRDRQEHWYMDLLLIADSRADNAYAGTTGAEVLPFENNAIDGSNPVLSRDWDRYMVDVARANRLIVNIDDVEDSALTPQERRQYKAEAKIFRAMIYFDMVRIWGNVPIITTEGRDITSETIEEVYDDYFPDQNTAQEVYEQIEQDLLEAIADAPNNDPGDKTLFTKSVARALLAKVYAEKPLRDYAKVIQYADQLMTDGFALEEDFTNLFGMNGDNTDAKMRNTRESILEAQFFAGNGNWVTWMFGRDLSNYDTQFDWAKWITPSRDLIQLFQAENDQIRFEESIVYYQTRGWSNYYPASHYPFMYKTRSAFNSIIKYRYADILLLKAEALILGTQDLEQAAAIIDQVRGRVDLPVLPSNVRNNRDLIFEALMKERRLELAFEGERWFDLARWEKVEEVMNAVFAKDEGRRAQAYQYTADSYLLPIPQGVLDQNQKLVQNPGY